MTKKYIIVGKTAGNEWLPITLIYPNLQDFPSTYETLEEAQRARGTLKQLMMNHPQLGKKVPYRIDPL